MAPPVLTELLSENYRKLFQNCRCSRSSLDFGTELARFVRLSWQNAARLGWAMRSSLKVA